MFSCTVMDTQNIFCQRSHFINKSWFLKTNNKSQMNIWELNYTTDTVVLPFTWGAVTARGAVGERTRTKRNPH